MRILSRAQLQSEKGIPYSNGYLIRLERENRFPKRVRFGPKRRGWIEDEIDSYLAERAADRGEGFRQISEAAKRVVDAVDPNKESAS